MRVPPCAAGAYCTVYATIGTGGSSVPDDIRAGVRPLSVSPEYRSFALEQLARVAPVTARSMFGGVGIYSSGLFFALIADDVLYFKVDDSVRHHFVDAGSEPFRPYGDERTMSYYALPGDVLEDVDQLRAWVERSLTVARTGRRR